MRWIFAIAFLMGTTAANALISCSVSSSGVTAAYIPTNAATLITQDNFTVTCARGLVVDPTSVTYDVKVNNGVNPAGNANKAKFSTNLIGYDVYLDSGCATQWKNNASLPTGGGSMTLSGLTPTSVTTSYWSCIPAGQLGLAAGTYTDTVTMTVNSTVLTQTTTGSFPVTIYTPASCTITTNPGNLNFGNYNSMISGTVLGSVTFGSTCTNTLPYSVALDTNSGIINGLQYTLLLNSNSSGIGNAKTLNVTGTGAEATFYINGAIAGGQSGTCASTTCTASQPHTITITY